MNRFLKKLNEPFPESDSPKEDFFQIIGVGVFVTLFLYFFQVGGLNRYDGNVFIICVYFGLITIIVSLFFDFIVDKVLKVERNKASWTLKKWLIYMLCLLLCISIANFSYYNFISGDESINFYDFSLMVINTVGVGIFPVIFSGLMIQINANKKNQSQAASIQSHLPKKEIQHKSIQLISNNKNQDFEAVQEHILYLEAMQNYVSICFIKNGVPKKELVRNTIKNIESQLKETSLVRCHRSFIVNSDLIDNVEGNAQGLKLDLKGLKNIQIPVSRKYIKILRERVND